MKIGDTQFIAEGDLGDLSKAILAVTVFEKSVRRLTGLKKPWLTFIFCCLLTSLDHGLKGRFVPVRLGEFPAVPFFVAVVSWFIPIINAMILYYAVQHLRLGGGGSADR